MRPRPSWILGQLAGGVAHDFNNLLTIVLGASETLGEQLQDHPELASSAHDIQAAGRRAADLVRHLLSFARRAPLGKALVDLHATLLEVRRLLEHTLDKRIELILNLGAPCSTVLDDASQIQNAVLNVALNARDAMPNGGPPRVCHR
jgi:signal transduction histidine kinase